MTAVQLHGQDLLQAAGNLGIKATTCDVSAELGDSSQNEGGSTNLKRSQCIAMFNAMQCLSLKMISTNQQKYHFQVFICISVLLAASSAQIGGFGGAHGPVGHHGGPGVGHGGFGHGGHGGGHGGHGIGHGYGHEIHEIIPYHYNYAVADSYSGARFDQASSVMEVAMHSIWKMSNSLGFILLTLFGHQEEQSNGAGTREGHYSVNLPDGRWQMFFLTVADFENQIWTFNILLTGSSMSTTTPTILRDMLLR